MKIQLTGVIIAVALLAGLDRAAAQGTAFTYQGRLNNNGNPANGSYDLVFSLYGLSSGGSPEAGPLTNSATGVTNGLFTVTLDFGAGVFNGSTYWLDISVRTNGNGAFADLSPRQQVTPAPYSIFSENAGLAASVSASVVSAPQLNTPGAPSSGQVLTYNGTSLVWSNPASGGSGWSLTGNAGTTPGTDFLGTTDNEPLELWVNGGRAFRLEPGNGGGPNVIGGSGGSADSSVSAGTIAGGIQNTVSNSYPTVSGGEYNKATANGAVVGGGYQNTASGREAAVSGGAQNNAAGAGAFVGGGGYDGTTLAGNSAGGTAATVAGGLDNNAAGPYATISGGAYNQAGSSYDAVPGGSYNVASGGNSFAAGHQAQALHNGAFVWADATGGAFQSTAVDQFSVRAEGGVRFVTAGAGVTIDGVPVSTGGGGGGSGWSLTGNGGTTPGVNFLGTTDSAGLELHVNSLRAMRFDYATDFGVGHLFDYDESVNVNGGCWSNIIASGVLGGTIAGGGDISYQNGDVVGNFANVVNGSYGSIGGGYGNSVGYGATVSGGIANSVAGNFSVACGGISNFISGTSYASTIGGGSNNYIDFSSTGSFIGAGAENDVVFWTPFSVIAGGYGNVAGNIYAETPGYSCATVGGGAFNLANGESTVSGGISNNAVGIAATIPGGIGNTAGDYAFAAGVNAQANDPYSFVWGDGTQVVHSQGYHTFVVQATGGVSFYTSGSGGATLAPGQTSWTSISDRNAKKNFQPVDAVSVLDKLAAIPIEQWNYKWENDSDVPNIGPMAQDFKKAFYPGRDEKGISTLEFDGVELAAIQGLNQKLQQEVGSVRAENAELKARLERLERLVSGK